MRAHGLLATESTSWREIALSLKNLKRQFPNDLVKEVRTKIEDFPLLIDNLWKDWKTSTTSHLQSERNYQKILKYRLTLLHMRKKWKKQEALQGKKIPSPTHASEWMQLGDSIEDAIVALEKGKTLFEKGESLPLAFFKELPEKKDIRAYRKLQKDLVQRFCSS